MAASSVNNIQIIKQAKINADKKGNNNKKLDTMDELTIFANILQDKEISNAKQLINGYNTNPIYYETLFERQRATATSSTDAAIIGTINKDSYVNQSATIKEEAEDIVKGIHEAVNYKWFFGLFSGTDDEKLRQKVGAITRENVLEVLNTTYPNGNMIDAIIDDVSQSDLDGYGKTFIGALVKKAVQQGVDITDIVEQDGEDFLVGTGVTGAKVGASATDKKYLKAVINALKERIENNAEIISDETKAKEDLSSTFTTLLKINDTNKNGYIDGEEIFAFKSWCNKLGISINEMLIELNEKKDKSQTLTKAEKTLESVFNSEKPLGQTIDTEKNKNRLVSHINQALVDNDYAKLSSLLESLNKDNVEEILSAISGGSTIGTTLANKFGNDAKALNEMIIAALYAKAVEYDVDVRDIVRQDMNNNFTTGTKVGSLGEGALDKKYVNTVIQKLRERIKSEIGE